MKGRPIFGSSLNGKMSTTFGTLSVVEKLPHQVSEECSLDDNKLTSS